MKSSNLDILEPVHPGIPPVSSIIQYECPVKEERMGSALAGWKGVALTGLRSSSLVPYVPSQKKKMQKMQPGPHPV